MDGKGWRRREIEGYLCREAKSEMKEKREKAGRVMDGSKKRDEDAFPREEGFGKKEEQELRNPKKEFWRRGGATSLASGVINRA